jgi:hypothetical protein
MATQAHEIEFEDADPLAASVSNLSGQQNLRRHHSHPSC